MITSKPDSITFVFALSCFFVTYVFGQNPPVGTPEIASFSKTEYKAGTQNWSIVQDEDGIMFFGNNSGILEFDGATWRLINLPNQTVVRSLALHENGKIYVGAQNELGFLAPSKTGLLTFHSMTKFIPVGERSFEDVWKIFSVEEKIFFCTKKSIFIIQDDKCNIIRPKGRFENFFEVNGMIYAQDIGYGLTVWNGTQFIPVKDGNKFGDGRLAAILDYGEKQLIVSDFQGLFLMDEHAIQSLDSEASELLKESQAYCAIKLHNNNYAIGTAQNGVFILDNEGQMKRILNKSSGLQNNTVLAVFKDQQHNLWLGLDNGIDYAKISSPVSVIHSESGIDGTGYASIVYQNSIYLGTNQGLFCLDLKEKQSQNTHRKFTKVQNLNGQVWSLNEDETGLIVNMHEGAYYLRDGQVTPLTEEYGAWKFMPLNDRPDYALGGTYSGLAVYQKSTTNDKKAWKYSNNIDGFDESARIFEQDEEGNIWVSHVYKGLYKIRLNADLATADVNYYNSSYGLPSDISIHVVKIKGEVVYTTPKGIYEYVKSCDCFKPHQKFNAILGGERNINRLIEDSHGRIWYSADDEFGVFEIREKGFLKEAHIEKQFFNNIQQKLVDGYEHIYALDEYNVFIASEKGFIHYNPSNAKRELTFNAMIRQVIAISGRDSVLFSGSTDEEAEDNIPMELASNMNGLRFSYCSPFFENAEHVQFRYKLDGFENVWSKWSSQTDKEFTNLKHGDYIFTLEARNTYGDISTPAMFRFTILPPWYASTIAKIFYLFIGILIITGLFKYFSKKLEKEKATLVEKQARTLEKKEAVFQEQKERSQAEIIRLRNENLKADIKHKNSQLASATMHLLQKGEILLKVKNELNKVLRNATTENKRKVQELIHTIDDDIRLDNDWEQFEAHFDQVHENFLGKLRESYAKLTPKDQKLCAYLRMNLSTKEIAPLMNISVRGVEIARYRLRKKLDLDTETNLVDFLMKY